MKFEKCAQIDILLHLFIQIQFYSLQKEIWIQLPPPPTQSSSNDELFGIEFIFGNETDEAMGESVSEPVKTLAEEQMTVSL